MPPAGLEPAHPAPEAGALSAELQGQFDQIIIGLLGTESIQVIIIILFMRNPSLEIIILDSVLGIDESVILEL